MSRNLNAKSECVRPHLIPDICRDCLPFFSNRGCGFSLLGNEIDGEVSSKEMQSAAGAEKPLRAMMVRVNASQLDHKKSS